MNTLKRYRVGRRELPARVVRRVIEQRSPIENDQPDWWELYDYLDDYGDDEWCVCCQTDGCESCIARASATEERRALTVSLAEIAA